MQGLSAARITRTADVRWHATAPTRARPRAGRRSLAGTAPRATPPSACCRTVWLHGCPVNSIRSKRWWRMPSGPRAAAQRPMCCAATRWGSQERYAGSSAECCWSTTPCSSSSGCRRDHPRLAGAVPQRRLRGAVSEGPRRPRSASPSAPRYRRAARGAEDRAALALGQRPHRRRARARGRAPAGSLHGASAALARRPSRQTPRRARRHRPATLRLPLRRRAVDERCHARTEGQRWAPTPKDLPHGLHRRCHPRAPLRRLRLLREHHRVPAGAQERTHPPGTSVEALRRQRCQLPLAPARPRVRQARHRAHPRSPLAASGKGENRALLQDASRRLARTPRRRCHLEPRGAQPQPLGLGRGRVPPIAPSRHRRAHPTRAVGARRRRRALPRPRPRPRRPVPLRGQTPRHEGPHREPARAALRGRCHPRGTVHHLALRPPGAGVAPPAGPPRRAPRRPCHTPRRLRQYQASLRSKRNFPVKRDRSSWHAQPDDPAPEPRPSPLAMQKLKEKK